MHPLRCLALVLAIATSAMPASALAAQPPRVPGAHCGALGAQIGPGNVWQTSFMGWRYDVFGDREDIFVAPCFASEADCTAWLYWAQSDWQHNFIQHPRCQKWAG
jgi:hypothetical protein